MALRPRLLLVPSLAARTEWPRRLAEAGHPAAGIYAFKLKDLARALAEPALLGRGLKAWDPGHDAFLASRLLASPHGLRLPPQAPRAPVAAALARTLAELRLARVPPERLERLAQASALLPDDQARLAALAALYRGFHEAREGRVTDPATLFRAGAEAVAHAAWLEGAEVLVVDGLDPDPGERELLAALEARLPVRRLALDAPDWSGTLLAPVAPRATPLALGRLREALFEPPTARPPLDPGAVELLTAPGEAAEVRAIARRLVRAAQGGLAFEDMGVILPRPADYAALFTDLLTRLGIPHRLHPSLPLRFGRAARSLLLLFRARGFERPAVMEFLTFAPVPWESLVPGVEAEPPLWDQLSRDAQIVSGLPRFQAGLEHYARVEREAAAVEKDAGRRLRREKRAADADGLKRVVEELASTLDALSGEATWSEWSVRLLAVLDRWVGVERDRDAVRDVIADLAGLSSLSSSAPWAEVESVLEARFEWERVPLDPVSTGAVHVGALEAMAGLTFRLVAIPGLVEGGYPGTPRPDPFLLDAERAGLGALTAPAAAPPAARRAQLSLFDERFPREPAPAVLPTTQDRVLEARRQFRRAVGQATERLILSYPRADSRSGRERLPSLFFVAAASALEGRPVALGDLTRLVSEDDPAALDLDALLDASERDRARVRKGGEDAARQIAAGSLFFRQSRLASKARFSSDYTAYDGLVAWAPRDGVASDTAARVRERLDPTAPGASLSASRLATYARCGFQYLLQHVLRLEPALEPEERKRLDPLERGTLFHEVAELFLRERRRLGELPVRDNEAMRARALQLADEALARLVQGSPPRFTLLWDRERQRFRETVLAWLAREAAATGTTIPAFFEVSFGLPVAADGEPHSAESLVIDLGDGRTLRVNGQIDRIDRAQDGTLVLRDYKTGKAPWKDDGGLFKGGRQLQIPFYILAAARLFPDEPVSRAFLDYVDGGRLVTVDPAVVKSETFTALLRGFADAISQGLFVQEPSACEWCDYTAVCGPAPLIALRRGYKINDPRVRHVLRLRDIG